MCNDAGLRCGAQSDPVDRFGDTPLMLAQQNQMHEVVALMQA